MDVGFMMLFASYGWENCSDAQTWNEELRLAELAADSGFDVMWSTEHHFEDYSFCPDNVQLMTHLAAKHPHIDVGTAAVILPWHDPLRVAEQVAMLDMLSGGRLRFGMGRGLARREFEGFRIPMDESRGRFDEAAPMIIKALETGFIEGDGEFFKQPRVEIRPRPQHSMAGRLYSVATSEESVESVPNSAMSASSCLPIGPGKCARRSSIMAAPCTKNITAARRHRRCSPISRFAPRRTIRPKSGRANTRACSPRAISTTTSSSASISRPSKATAATSRKAEFARKTGGDLTGASTTS